MLAHSLIYNFELLNTVSFDNPHVFCQSEKTIVVAFSMMKAPGTVILRNKEHLARSFTNRYAGKGSGRLLTLSSLFSSPQRATSEDVVSESTYQVETSDECTILG